MLIFLPSTPATQNASEYLTKQGVEHQVIDVPKSLDYKTGSDICIYIDSEDHTHIPMELTKQRFVVMRVFKDYKI